MSYRVIIEKPAKLEIDEAALWIAQFSPEQATLWYLDPEKALESLRNFPARCPVVSESMAFKSEIRQLNFWQVSHSVSHRRRNCSRPLFPPQCTKAAQPG